MDFINKTWHAITDFFGGLESGTLVFIVAIVAIIIVVVILMINDKS